MEYRSNTPEFFISEKSVSFIKKEYYLGEVQTYHITIPISKITSILFSYVMDSQTRKNFKLIISTQRPLGFDLHFDNYSEASKYYEQLQEAIL